MDDLSNTIKLFYLKITKRGEVYKRHGVKPTRDWSIILITNSIFFILLGILAIYFYLQINSDSLFTMTETNKLKEVKINTAVLKQIIDDIKNREEMTIKIINGEVNSFDPSI